MNADALTNTNGAEQHSACGCACAERIVRPDVDIVEDADGVVITLETPGAGPEDVDMSVERGVLTIVARVTERAPGNNARIVLRETSPGDFRREFRIGEMLDGSRIDATLDRGVLSVRIPRAEASKPRKISVRAG